MEWIVRDLPQPLLGIGTFLLLWLSALGGNRARQVRAARHDLGSTQEGYVVSAVLGLLALLMGFTFSMAADRHSNRHGLVTYEANAIVTTYALTQTFEEPHRIKISALLLEYFEIRLALGEAGGEQKVERLLEESEQIQEKISVASLAAIATVRDDISSAYLSSTVGMFEVGQMRTVARRAHIPTHIYTILFIYMGISAAVMGYAFSGSPQAVTNGTLFVLLTMSMLLIIDLDRPSSGYIVDSQAAMESMKSRLVKSRSAANLPSSRAED